MSVLEELATATATLAERVGPSVVGIGRGWGSGSGVVLSGDLVLTNAHHLRHEGPMTVVLANGETVDAEIRGRDDEGDLAVLALPAGSAPGLDAATDPPSVGSVVFALANPGGRGLRVTFGLVAAVGRSFPGPGGRPVPGALEHTAPLPRGSSGGPLVDGEGRLVALNTNRLGEGFYAAIPFSDEVRARLEGLQRGQTPRRVRLGVAIAPPGTARRLRRAVGLPERDGLLIREVAPEGPAGRAGVRVGDLLVGVAGAAVTSPDDLWHTLESAAPGSSLELSIVRGAEELGLQVTFDA